AGASAASGSGGDVALIQNQPSARPQSRSDSVEAWLTAPPTPFKVGEASGVSPAGTPAAAPSPLRPSRRHRLGGRVAILSSLAALTCLFALIYASSAQAAGPK